MPTDKIFPDQESSSLKLAEKKQSPKKPPRWRMPFWVWLVLTIIVAAVVVALILWLGGIKLPSADINTGENGNAVIEPTPVGENLPIVITSPRSGDKIGNPVQVTGRGSSIENVIKVRVKDSQNNILADFPTTTNAEGPGLKGDFSVDISYRMPVTEYGFVEAYTESMADGSTQNLYSARVQFSEWSEQVAASEARLAMKIDTYQSLESYDIASSSVTQDFEDAYDAEYGGATAVKVNIAYVAKPIENKTKIAISQLDLLSGESSEITQITSDNEQEIAISGLAASPQVNKIAVGVGYYDSAVFQGESPARYRVFTCDIESGEIAEIYAKDSPGVYFAATVNQWSAANEVFVYEFIGDALGGAFGETIKVNLGDNSTENLSTVYDVYGASRVSPDGTKIIFVQAGSESITSEPGIILLDLTSGEKNPILTASSQEEMESLGVGLLASTIPEWTADGQKLVWASREAVVQLVVADSSLTEFPCNPQGVFTEAIPYNGRVYAGITLEAAAGSQVLQLDLATGESNLVYQTDLTATLLGVF